jgi:hypothetical protein
MHPWKYHCRRYSTSWGTYYATWSDFSGKMLDNSCNDSLVLHLTFCGTNLSYNKISIFLSEISSGLHSLSRRFVTKCTLNFFYHDKLNLPRLKTVNSCYRFQKLHSIFAWESGVFFSYYNSQCWRIKIKWSEAVKCFGTVRKVSQSKLLDSVENFSIISYGMPHTVRRQHFIVKVQNQPQTKPYNGLWTVLQGDRILFK